MSSSLWNWLRPPVTCCLSDPSNFLSITFASISYVFSLIWTSSGGPGSSVGIATELRAGRSGIESRWGRDFPPVQTGPGAHPASYKMGTGSFPGVKCGRSVLLTTQPLLVPRSWKSRAIPLPTLWATPGLQRDQFTFYEPPVKYASIFHILLISTSLESLMQRAPPSRWLPYTVPCRSDPN